VRTGRRAALADAKPGVAWCHLNDEGDLLTKLIDGAVQVSGSDTDEAKEEKLAAFSRGEIRVLVTKPKLGAWGLNWQHCHRMTYFPSHSYEQYYQAVRRSWRFGQTRPVSPSTPVDVLITTPGGEDVFRNLDRKAKAADAMFDALTGEVADMPEAARSHRVRRPLTIPLAPPASSPPSSQAADPGSLKGPTPMKVLDQTITDRFAAYNGDCMEVLPALPGGRSICRSTRRRSPGCTTTRARAGPVELRSYEEFFEHYEYVVRRTPPSHHARPDHRRALHGRPHRQQRAQRRADRLPRRHHPDARTSSASKYTARYHVWKEPLAVRNRTMTKSLAHKTIVDDSTQCGVASADYLLVVPEAPATTPSRRPPDRAHRVRRRAAGPGRAPPVPRVDGKQTENRYSHWMWRQYASAFWDDVRLDHVLPFREARDDEDEKHVHPLQLDVIHRGVVLWSNPGERVLTPFMGVGSEVYAAVRLGRSGIGVELKPSYYRQAVLRHHCRHVVREPREDTQ
jgi:hypothetical protein